MIYIISKEDSPRLQYIVDVIFRLILEMEYNILQKLPPDAPASQVLHYGEINGNGSISIPKETLLFESDFQAKEVTIRPAKASTGNSIPGLYLSGSDFTSFSLDFDIFSAAFYVITEYYRYTEKEFDEHARYREDLKDPLQEVLQKTPLVHEYAAQLRQLLARSKTSSSYDEAEVLTEKSKRKFDYLLSFDIDSPYFFRHKPLLVQAGGLLKNLVRGDWKNLSLRVRIIMGANDPFDVYDYLEEKADKEKLLFFFLIDRHSTHDERHTYRNENYCRLIKRIAAISKIGIHPSYTSFMSAEQINFEKLKLESITHSSITRSRMHYLKYRLPDTFRFLADAGIKEDYTMCFVHKTGFKNGMAIAFPWFDVAKNQVSSLFLHPTMVMDRALERYRHLTATEAFDEIQNLIEETAKWNGRFTLLFHNNTLSEHGEWKGWRWVFEKTLRYLQAKSAAS